MRQWLDDIRSAWLGKIIGVRLGAPVENWTSQQIKTAFGKIEDFVLDYPVFGADDDTNGPFYFTRVLNQKPVEQITPQDIADNMLNVIAEEHGFFWWGGPGISTEHTMFDHLKKGVSAYESGKCLLIGKELSEQIGGQIFSDGWAYVAYDNTDLAVSLAQKAAQISHDGEAVQGAIFVSAAISLGFKYDDIQRVILYALTYCDPQSDYVRVALEIIDYAKSAQSWEDTLSYIQSVHPYSRYGGICPIIPNMAVMIMSMIHGKGDFKETLLICVNAGWDTDCNAGNVGSIMGALVGPDGLYKPWIDNVNDVVISSGLLGSINMLDASQQTMYFGYLAQKINPSLQDDRLVDDNHLSFTLPYATHGFYGQWHRYFDGSHTPVKKDNKHVLQINVHGAYPDALVNFIKKTYFKASEFYDARYEPSVAPIVWPGQCISTRLKAKQEGLFEASLIVRDIHQRTVQSEFIPLDEHFSDFSLVIPSDFSIIHEMGFEIISKTRTFLTHLWMDDFLIEGNPHFKWNLANLPMEDFGYTFSMDTHQEVASCTHLSGNWRVNEHGITTISDGDAFLLFGDVRWQNNTAQIHLKEWSKGSSICFGVQGAYQYMEILKVDDTSYQVNHIDKQKLNCLKQINFDDFVECITIQSKKENLTLSFNQKYIFSLTSLNDENKGSLGFKTKSAYGLTIQTVEIT